MITNCRFGSHDWCYATWGCLPGYLSAPYRLSLCTLMHVRDFHVLATQRDRSMAMYTNVRFPATKVPVMMWLPRPPDFSLSEYFLGTCTTNARCHICTLGNIRWMCMKFSMGWWGGPRANCSAALRREGGPIHAKEKSDANRYILAYRYPQC